VGRDARCREKRCMHCRDRSSAAQSPAYATKSAEERHVAGLKPTRLLPQRLFSAVKSRQERPILQEMRSQWRQAGPFVVNVAYVAVRDPANGTINGLPKVSNTVHFIIYVRRKEATWS